MTKDGKREKIEEWGKIKTEEKRDTLALVEVKKKRYGAKLARLTKDENTKIRRRTEERKEMALALHNLWRKCREVGEAEIKEEERWAWEKIHDCLEDEKDDCVEIKIDQEMIQRLLKRKVCLKEDVPGTGTGVGDGVAPVGGQVPDTDTDTDPKSKKEAGSEEEKDATATDVDKINKKKRTYNSEADDGAGKADNNLKTITHNMRQKIPSYILHRNKEVPPVTKNSGGSLITDLIQKFEGCRQEDTYRERVYRFGENLVMESPNKRQKHTPVKGIPPTTNLCRSPWRPGQPRRGLRPGSTQAWRTSSPSSSRRSCSENPSTRTAHHVVHPPQTDNLIPGHAPLGRQDPSIQTSSQTPVGRQEHHHHQYPLEGPGPGPCHHTQQEHHQLQHNPPKNDNNKKMKNVKEIIEEINHKEIAKHENKFENITKKEEDTVDKICE
jgi:hypothetical protein